MFEISNKTVKFKFENNNLTIFIVSFSNISIQIQHKMKKIFKKVLMKILRRRKIIYW